MDYTAEDIYEELHRKYKGIMLEALANYDDVFREYMMFIAEGEAEVYLKVSTVNGDSYCEQEGERLLGLVTEAKKELELSINNYTKIERNKGKIIRNLEPFIQQNKKLFGNTRSISELITY